MDVVDTRLLMQTLLDRARSIRAQYKYSEDEKMMPCALILRPDGDSVVIPLPFRDSDEKRQMMRVIAEGARKLQAVAVAVVSDTRWVKSEDFCRYFKIDPPTRETISQFKTAYHATLRRYGGHVKNLPREVWHEAVCVMVKGPEIPTDNIMETYIEGPNDTVRFIPTPLKDRSEDWRAEADLIPDWWTN
jgi:hypothetical protein